MEKQRYDISNTSNYHHQNQNFRKKKKKNKGYAIVTLCILGILGVIIARNCIPFFMSTNKINQKTYEIYDNFDIGLAEISRPFYNENGYVERENIPGMFDAVEDELKKGIEEGIISSYSRDDENNSIFIEYRSGIKELFSPQEEGMLSGSGNAYITTIEPTRNYIFTNISEGFSHAGIWVGDHLEKYDFPYTGDMWPDTCAEMITEAYPELYRYNTHTSDPIIDLNTLFPFKKSKTGRFTSGDVTMDIVKNLAKAKIVIWEGHGYYNSKTDYHSCLVTGQAKSWSDFNKYKEDMKNDYVFVTNRELSFDYLLEAFDAHSLARHYVVSSKFFDKYLGDMDGALVFLGACDSMHDDVLAQSFINKGANVVYGYTEETSMIYEMITRAFVFHALSNGYSAGDALEYAKYYYEESDSLGGRDAQLTVLYSNDSMADIYYLDGVKSETDSTVETSEPDLIDVRTADDLYNIKNDLSGNYIIKNDINLKGYSWNPIGTSDQPFTGSLNGNGHTISGLVLNIDSSSNYSGGLFGVVNGGDISDVKLEGASIYVNVDNTGESFSYVGGIAGEIFNGRISQCSASGFITSKGSNQAYARAGGICGSAVNSVISNSHVNTVIKADADTANTMAGGIAAWLDSSTAENCLVYGSITANDTNSYSYAGGIHASGSSSIIKNCVVLADSIEAFGIKKLVHPVNNFSELQNCLAANDIIGEFTSNDYVTFISRSNAFKQETYENLDWNFDKIWMLSDHGVVLR